MFIEFKMILMKMKDGDENMRDDGENMIYLCKVFLWHR